MGKRSRCELTRLVEQAITEICGLPLPGLWFCVDAVEALGRPPHRFAVWATLHLHPEGSPFCCGEPGCHLGLMTERLHAVGDHLRRALRLRHEVEVDLTDHIAVRCHPGVILGVQSRTTP